MAGSSRLPGGMLIYPQDIGYSGGTGAPGLSHLFILQKISARAFGAFPQAQIGQPCYSKRKKEKGSRDYFPDATKTDVDAPDAWHDPATFLCAQAPRTTEERTAAQHPQRSLLRPARVVHSLIGRQGPVVVLVVPVSHPLPNIAGHIVQPPSVCRVRSYRRSSLPLAATVIRVLGSDVVPPRILQAVFATTRRVFPLGFGRESAPGPLTIGLRLIPGYADNRVILFAPVGVEIRGRRHFELGPFADEPLVGRDGHRGLPQPETPGDAHAMPRLLVLASLVVAGDCPHPRFSGR